MKNKELLNRFIYIESLSKSGLGVLKIIWIFKIIAAVICCSYVKLSYLHEIKNLIAWAKDLIPSSLLYS